MKFSDVSNIPCFLLDYRIHGTNTSIEKKELGDKNRLEVQTQIFKYLFNQDMSDEIKSSFNLLYTADNCLDDDIKNIISCLEQVSCIENNDTKIDKETFLYYMARRWFIFCIHNKKFCFFKPKFIKLQYFLKFVIGTLYKKF